MEHSENVRKGVSRTSKLEQLIITNNNNNKYYYNRGLCSLQQGDCKFLLRSFASIAKKSRLRIQCSVTAENQRFVNGQCRAEIEILSRFLLAHSVVEKLVINNMSAEARFDISIAILRGFFALNETEVAQELLVSGCTYQGIQNRVRNGTKFTPHGKAWCTPPPPPHSFFAPCSTESTR